MDLPVIQSLDEVSLRSLSSHIGDEWEMVGTHLGLRRDQIERLKQDNSKMEDQVFDMLLTWKRKQPGDGIQLAEALQKSGRVDLALNVQVTHSGCDRKVLGTQASTQSRNRRDLPVIQSLDEVSLRSLSSHIGDEWEMVGTHLGLRRDQIERLKQGNSKMEDQVFDMLVTWRRKQPGDGIQLAEALRKSGRVDLALNVQVTNSGCDRKVLGTQASTQSRNRRETPSSVSIGGVPKGVGIPNLEVCQRELVTFYEQEMATVQLLPWGHDVVEMDAIFVNLSLSVDDKRHVGRTGKSLGGPEELLDFKSSTGQKVNRVLVKGFAGSGKSTAMAKLAYDWARYLKSGKEGKESTLSRYKLLFVLSLREIERNEALIDAILDQILSQDTAITKTVLESFFHSHGKDILILLDGLDEYPMEQLQKKVTGDFESLLANRKMRETCVVVTTRPQKVEDLGEHQKHYTQVRLSGFSEDNIGVYIMKFFQGDEKVAEGLIEVLANSPSIKSLAEIPVMLLMLCLLWSDAEMLPDTSTALYEQVILYLWKRYHNSCDVSETNDDMSEVLLALGHVALDGLTSSGGKLVFSDKDFPDHVLEKACKVGLLTKERLRSKLNLSNSVTFLHKSVQEYCAAYYWITLADKYDDSFQSYLLQITDDDQVFAQAEMLKFSCAMSKKASALILPHAVQVLKHRTEDSLRIGGMTQAARKDLWPLFLMLKESKFEYDVAVHSWLEPLFQSKVVEIRQNPPSSLGYFHHLVKIAAKSKITSVLSGVRELKLLCGAGSFRLIVETLDEMIHVQALVLSWETEIVETGPSESQVAALSDKICKLSQLLDITVLARHRLDITRIIASLNRGSKGITSIRKIELGNVEFETVSMGNTLKRQKSLASLLLTNIPLTPQGTAQMLSQIQSSIHNIHFVNCKVGKAIQHLKPLMPSLEDLILTNAGLQENHVAALAKLLPRAGKLKQLDLSWNNIGSSMAKLTRGLQHSPQLRKLTFMNANIPQSGAIALTESFQYMPHLVDVVVSIGTLGYPHGPQDNGLDILEAYFRSLHHLPKLEILDVQRLPLVHSKVNDQMVPVSSNKMVETIMTDIDYCLSSLCRSGVKNFGFQCKPLNKRLPKLREAIYKYLAEEEGQSTE